MNAVAQIFAVLAAVIYIFVFPVESFLLRRNRWAQKFLSTHYPRKWESVPGTLAATVPALVALLLLPLGP